MSTSITSLHLSEDVEITPPNVSINAFTGAAREIQSESPGPTMPHPRNTPSQPGTESQPGG